VDHLGPADRIDAFKEVAEIEKTFEESMPVVEAI